MKLIGLMITRDDHAVFADWCASQLPFYDAVVCLDGSDGDATARLAEAHSGRLVYLHESDYSIPHKTDHGLRRVVHEEIVRRFGNDVWVMCCHADEFCYHDPRKVAVLAAADGYDAVAWSSLHFVPHPTEMVDWPRRRHLPITERFRHYHWSHEGSGLPWREQRLYRNGPGVRWDGVTHGSTAPHGLARPAPLYPILQHYKVTTTDLDAYEPGSHASHYKTHWAGLDQRTGLAFGVRHFEDFFVADYPPYARRDHFDGVIPHAWNIGEQYRPDPVPASHRLALPGRDVHVPFRTRGPVDRAVLQEVWQRDAYGIAAVTEPPAIVVDVGAHIGAFALAAALAWPQARIIACEPDPDNFALLQANLADYSNVELVNAAITDQDVAELEFFAVPDKAGSNSGGGSCVRPEQDSRCVRVPALAVDRLWRLKQLERCDLLKLDCEGAELPVLRRLAATGLLESVRKLVGEWHTRHDSEPQREQVRFQLRDILRPTHKVHFSPVRHGREGLFTAQAHAARPAIAHAS